jgi:hypothetical protein
MLARASSVRPLLLVNRFVSKKFSSREGLGENRLGIQNR